MKSFNYKTAINQLGLKTKPVNYIFNIDIVDIKDLHLLKLPYFARVKDFVFDFLPYLTLVGDSREQDNWVEDMAREFGIGFLKAVKNKKEKTENLKEGDYTFIVNFARTYDFTGVVAYERKGSVSELYNNCQADRGRLNNEFDRFNDKKYKKVVMLLEFGEKLTDLLEMSYTYYEKGKLVKKDCGRTIYSTLMSWKQPNNKDFEILQSENRSELFWLMLIDMFYFFRQELRLECYEKNLITGEGENE